MEEQQTTHAGSNPAPVSQDSKMVMQSTENAPVKGDGNSPINARQQKPALLAGKESKAAFGTVWQAPAGSTISCF